MSAAQKALDVLSSDTDFAIQYIDDYSYTNNDDDLEYLNYYSNDDNYDNNNENDDNNDENGNNDDENGNNDENGDNNNRMSIGGREYRYNIGLQKHMFCTVELDNTDDNTYNLVDGEYISNIILLDLDNKYELLNGDLPNKSYVFGFISKSNLEKVNYDLIVSKCQLYVIDSDVKYSSESLMIFHSSSIIKELILLSNGYDIEIIEKLYGENKDIKFNIKLDDDLKIIIASTSKFNNILKEIIGQIIGYSNCITISHIDDLSHLQ